jgi:hypothetical protein
MTAPELAAPPTDQEDGREIVTASGMLGRR